MQNPFKTDDKVLTKVKGVEAEASVAQVFNNEVQVKTADGKLLWRTMHTVWFPGSAPIAKAAKPVATTPTETPSAAPTPSGVSEGGGVAEVHAAGTVEHIAEDAAQTGTPNAEPTAAPQPEEHPAPNKSRKGRHGRGGKGRNHGQ